MNTYDIIIIGAGPAGSSAALVAAKSGAKVLLIDKRNTIGVPVQCAEFVPALIRNLVVLPDNAIAQRIKCIETIFPDKFRDSIKAPGYILNRELLDISLASSASEAGAVLLKSAKAYDIIGNKVLFHYRDIIQEVSASVIIGADGPNSLVAGKMNFCRLPFAIAEQVELTLPGVVNNALIFFHHLYKGGYAWIFPKGESANIGVALLPGYIKASEALAHFIDVIHYNGERILRKARGIIPIGGPYRSCVKDIFLLCGDAGGFTNPLTGAGIVTAITSGKLAGEAAIKFIDSNEPLESYDAAWNDLLGISLYKARLKRDQWNKRWSSDPVKLSEMLRENWPI